MSSELGLPNQWPICGVHLFLVVFILIIDTTFHSRVSHFAFISITVYPKHKLIWELYFEDKYLWKHCLAVAFLSLDFICKNSLTKQMLTIFILRFLYQVLYLRNECYSDPPRLNLWFLIDTFWESMILLFYHIFFSKVAPNPWKTKIIKSLYLWQLWAGLD